MAQMIVLPRCFAVLVTAAAITRTGAAAAPSPAHGASGCPSRAASNRAARADDAVSLLQTAASGKRRSEGGLESSAVVVTSAISALHGALEKAVKALRQRHVELKAVAQQRDAAVLEARQAKQSVHQRDAVVNQIKQDMQRALSQAAMKDAALAQAKLEMEKQNATMKSTVQRWDAALTAVKQTMQKRKAAFQTAMQQRDMASSQAREGLAQAKEEMQHQHQALKKELRELAKQKDSVLSQHDAALKAALQQRDVMLQKTMQQRNAAIEAAKQRDDMFRKAMQQRDAALIEAKQATAQAKQATASLSVVEGEMHELQHVLRKSAAARRAYQVAMEGRSMVAGDTYSNLYQPAPSAD